MTKPVVGLRAVAYIRVSSEEQLDGHSLDAKRRAIDAACAERGWTLVAWYADEGVSAHTDDITKRPAFHQLVMDAEARRFILSSAHCSPGAPGPEVEPLPAGV